MKQLIKFTFIAIISSFMTLLGSKYVEGKDKVTIIHQNESFRNNSYQQFK